MEKWIRDTILSTFSDLTSEDVRVTIGQETGADIKLTKKAKGVCPFKFEAKNREALKGIYAMFEQAQGHEGKEDPVLVLKCNRKSPLVVIDAALFFRLISERKRND